MKKKIFFNASILVILSVVISFIAMSRLMYHGTLDDMKEAVRDDCLFLRNVLEETDAELYLEKLCDGIKSRVTYIDEDGTVIYDSAADSENMSNHSGRPEVSSAESAGVGSEVRYSTTLDEQTFYYAMVLSDGSVIRVARTTDSVLRSMVSGLVLMCVILLVIGVLAVILAGKTAQRLVRPLNRLDLNRPLENKAYEELSPLLVRIDKQNRQIKTQMEQLKKNQEEYVAITEHMKDGLIVTNKKVVLSINHAATELFGIEREECIGHDIITVSRNEVLREVLESVFSGREKEVPVDIGGRTYQLIGNPVYDEHGTITGAVIFIMDVTEKQKAEMMRREFSANVSHELKTPLMSISGYAEIMKNGMVRPEDMKKFAGRIFSEANRLSTLVEDIIKLSRLDEDDGSLPMEDTDLLKIAGEVSERLVMRAASEQIQVEVSGTSIVIEGARQVLYEMIYNLCDNAIKYNHVGGHVWITVGENTEGHRIVSVRDDGIGIAKEHQDRIFERFYRVDKSHSKETGGTGLGLSIVKHGAILHGAALSLQSEPGKGTEITIDFGTAADTDR